ncbi:MAG: hypothetical protein JKY37_19600 [Nannocystaceae bacterium]|nr:hypothetical protein [Nannocystaceae bacterium]
MDRTHTRIATPRFSTVAKRTVGAPGWRPLVVVALAALLGPLGREDEKPPAPPAAPDQAHKDSAGAAEAASDAPRLSTTDAAFVLTFAGDKGAFADSSKLDAVPEASRGMVRVKLLSGPDAPAGSVWVANLRKPDADGEFQLSTVARADFEELALGQGLSSKVTVPEGLEPPEQLPAAPAGTVVVYKTAWCGVCKKLEAYLKKKGVAYETKDVEKDRGAAAELKAKAAKQGGWKGSVPVIEVGDTLITGFDRARLEKLLG